MTLNYIGVRGSTRSERQESISRAKEAIQASGGWILDFKLFSNVSISVSFEAPLRGIEKLFSMLIAADIHLDRESEELLASYMRDREQLSERRLSTEVPGVLQLIFIHNEPDLRIEVPAIPG
ncbi:MAG TPA: hypothetical protein VNH22_17685 [Blastocatellia bacterium]|jgi:hypothetical protein|nr:hypothetical protein [Blastocatellia bacterium]